MAQIDFYILRQSGEQARQTFACRLAEKAYRLDNTVHIHTDSKAIAERIDELLWTFRDGSFVPHHLAGHAQQDLASPVTIGFGADDVEPRDLLINLSDAIPECSDAFPRVAELVTSDEDCKQRSRKRFAEYREQGHQLETHKV
ncbi:MAG: DNA polymerase III subunit chi [Proteobacteria bacterium]|nr:DNA polymerase III subunit chi [Pseudomonadota bacterium]